MSSRPNSRPVSRQPSRSGNNQYPTPQYDNQSHNYTAVPAAVPEPSRDQPQTPYNPGYSTSDPVDQSQGYSTDYKQQNASAGIQLGAYPQNYAAGSNPAYGQQYPPQYPPVQYGGGGSQELGPLGQYMTQHDQQGQGLAPPTVQYPAVLYDQQHSNYAQHEPHTQVRLSLCAIFTGLVRLLQQANSILLMSQVMAARRLQCTHVPMWQGGDLAS